MSDDPNYEPETFEDVLRQMELGVPLRYVPGELFQDELPVNWTGDYSERETLLVLGRYICDAGLAGDVSNAICAGQLIEEQDPDLPCVFSLRLA